MAITNLNLRVEIEDETNAIRVWYPGSDAPSLFQPDWPNGTPWASREEAQAWADLYVASLEDDDAPYAPHGPGEAGAPKPTAEEIAEMQARMQARRNGELPN